MEAAQVLKEVNDIFIDVLDNNDIVLTRDTTAKEVEDWDSLSNIQIVIAIEKHFKIRFLSSEIQSFKNLGEMLDTIQAKLV